MKAKHLILLLLSVALLWGAGCTKETVTPETFGNIQGQVLDGESGDGVSSVNITTSPATNSIITNQDGSFSLDHVTTGQYSITAKKSGYESATVNVKVREGETATAQIYLNADGSNTSDYFSAKVTAWSETTSNDSTFAEVEYQVSNTSDNTNIQEYEVYFDIYTTGNTFSKEVGDTVLSAGERNIGDFRKYVRQTTIDSVIVSGTYTK